MMTDSIHVHQLDSSHLPHLHLQAGIFRQNELNSDPVRKEMGQEKEHKEAEEEEEEPGSSQLSTKEPNLQNAIQLISSLISLSCSIKVFLVKWQLIRNRLEHLNSSLTRAENCDGCENSKFLKLIPSIILTVNESYSLANQCVNLSYGGKLRMQSDLDVVTAKFDSHLKKLDRIYNAGILTHGYAIVVSRPGVGASCDVMKFYIRDLLARLKIGDSYMKTQALVALDEIIREDERRVKIIVETGELTTLLANLLEFSEMKIREESAKLVSVIAGFDSCKAVLIGAGIIAPLIRILKSGSELGKESAARALQKLTDKSNNAWSVSAHDGATALLKICTNGGSRELIDAAFGSLKNLAGVEEMRRFMVEKGAISAFIKLINSKEEYLQINSIDLLQVMASEDDYIRKMIIREGGIHSLVCILDPKSSFSSKAREDTLRAIQIFCFSSECSVNILMSSVFLEWLLFSIHNGEISVQELAMKTSYHLSSATEETKKAMGDAGYIPEFIRLLDAKSFEIREMAAEALSNLVLVPRNRRRLVNEDCDVDLILQLLDPVRGKTGNKKFLLSILMSLTSCNGGRRKIANSCYLKNLEKLAEYEVIDAKRIIRKLSTNRIHSMLSRIWDP